MLLKQKSIVVIFSLIFFCCFSFSCLHKRNSKKYIHGGCCLAGGTNVRLANGKNIVIENLKVGDTILAFDKTKKIFLPSKVLKLAQTEHSGFVRLSFPSGEGISQRDFSTITITNDHPVWVKGKGWCSFNPEMTKRVLAMKDVQQLNSGDICFT